MAKWKNPRLWLWASIAALLLFAMVSVLVAAGEERSFYSLLFFQGGKDMFMDYLNSIRDSSTLETFTVQRTQYPALAALYFYFVGLFIPKEQVDLPFAERTALLKSGPAMISYVLFICAIVAIFIVSIHRIFKHHSPLVQGVVIGLSLLVYPLLYAFERGNIIVASLAFLLLFVAFHDHENRIVREIALIALSISIVIKLYPVVFALFLLRKKDFYGFLKVAVYSALLFFVPFVIYGGAEGLSVMIYQILKFSSGKSESTTTFTANLSILINNFGGPSALATFFNFASLVLLICALFFVKKDYQIFLICFLIMSRIGGAAGTYACIYVLPVFLLLLADKEVGWRSFFYVLALIPMLYVFGFKHEKRLAYQYLFLGGCWLAMIDLIIICPASWLVGRVRDRKNPPASA